MNTHHKLGITKCIQENAKLVEGNLVEQPISKSQDDEILKVLAFGTKTWKFGEWHRIGESSILFHSQEDNAKR